MSQHSWGLGRDSGITITRTDIGDRLLDDYEVAKLTDRARSTLKKDRVPGTGIHFVRIGRLVRYRVSTVAQFLDRLPSRRSTSEPAVSSE